MTGTKLNKFSQLFHTPAIPSGSHKPLLLIKTQEHLNGAFFVFLGSSNTLVQSSLSALTTAVVNDLIIGHEHSGPVTDMCDS